MITMLNTPEPEGFDYDREAEAYRIVYGVVMGRVASVFRQAGSFRGRNA